MVDIILNGKDYAISVYANGNTDTSLLSFLSNLQHSDVISCCGPNDGTDDEDDDYDEYYDVG